MLSDLPPIAALIVQLVVALVFGVAAILIAEFWLMMNVLDLLTRENGPGEDEEQIATTTAGLRKPNPLFPLTIRNRLIAGPIAALIISLIVGGLQLVFTYIGQYWSLGPWNAAAIVWWSLLCGIALVFVVVKSDPVLRSSDPRVPIVQVLMPMLRFGSLLLVLFCGFLIWKWYAASRMEWANLSDKKPNGWSQIGQYGDMFGGLNALFSGFAFAGILFTIFLQMRELALQREEMRDSRLAQQELADAARKERVDRAIELFQLFRNDHMKNARDLAWKARKKWLANQNNYQESVKTWFFQEQEERVWTDDDKKEWSATFDMLEFFGMLAVNEGNEAQIRDFTFYYHWWRGFLREFAKAYEDAYDALALTDHEKQIFPKTRHLQHLIRLEKKLGMSTEYIPDEQPFDRLERAKHAKVEREEEEGREEDAPGSSGDKPGEPPTAPPTDEPLQ